MTRRCEDKNCKYYGKELVDRGYGYPVCPSVNPNLNPKPLAKIYKEELRINNLIRI